MLYNMCIGWLRNICAVLVKHYTSDTRKNTRYSLLIEKIFDTNDPENLSQNLLQLTILHLTEHPFYFGGVPYPPNLSVLYFPAIPVFLHCSIALSMIFVFEGIPMDNDHLSAAAL